MTRPVAVDRVGAVAVITINRPEVRNAVDLDTAQQLYRAFTAFAADDATSVAVLTGAGGTFCAGADLGAIAAGTPNEVTVPPPDRIVGTPGPMGPSRLVLPKPVIAAIEGHAVAGGLELAVWADLRVMASDAVLGVYCRRWGVPLIDGGTVRLPRLIGEGRALDLILTGRDVHADEALGMGLVNRVCAPGEALATAIDLAEQIASFPQECMRLDRASAIAANGLVESDALAFEVRQAVDLADRGLVRLGAQAFTNRSAGDHG